VAAGALVCFLLPAVPHVPSQERQAQAGLQPTLLKTVDQGQNDPRLKGYFTPDGIKVEIVAEEPVVLNPVGMAFDGDGTPYVLEWAPGKASEGEISFTFRDGTQRKITVMRKPVKDRVKMLRDRKGKGVYDEARVVLEAELPSTILFYDGWMYLTGQGTVRRYRVKADAARPRMEVIARGFCGYGQNQVSGLTLGNDGLLYITAGGGDNVVEGSDGSRADVLRTGAVFRCRPDGSKMEAFALGLRNPYRDVSFDAAYNVFHADNGPDCRLLHVAEGNDFGWRVRAGAPCCEADPLRTATSGGKPGRMAAMLQTGRGSAAGLLVYNDARFPEPYRGLLYYADASRKLVRAYRVEPKGATFAVVEEIELFKADDPLFRPCQMVVGPDGAMYVCDWRTDSGGAGRLSGDGKHGRIYRLTWAGTKDRPAIAPRGMDSWARVIKQSDENLVKALASADFTDRRRAREELARRAGHKEADARKVVPALLKLVKDADEPLPGRLTAVGALQAFWSAEVAEVFITLLQDPNPDLRRLAADGLGLNTRPGNREVHEALVQALGDEDPAARRAIILAIGRINAAGAADVVAGAVQFDDGKDVYLHDGTLRAVERVGRPAVDKLLALADTGVEGDLDRVVAAFLAFRTRPGVEALPALLKKYHLTAAQRADLLRSYANYVLDPPISLEPVAEYLAGLPRPPRGVKLSAREAAQQAALLPVKLAGLEVLSSGGSHPGARAQAIVLALLDDADVRVRIASTGAAAAMRLAKAEPRLALMLRHNTLSAEERTAITRALRVLQRK
jgi:putative membrane-bound dehydrogenase-like protein